MELIWFESVVVGRSDGQILLAFMDGEPRRCVAIFNCTLETAGALRFALSSALQPQHSRENSN